jgi:membrane fusion protein (multidrug efflux system)
MKLCVRVLSSFVAALGVAATLAGCTPTEAEPTTGHESRTVTVIRPQRRELVRTLALPGDVVGFTEAALYAKVTGYLQRIAVDKGDWVKQGQLLAVIEVPELDQKLKRARATLEVERVTMERLRKVWGSDRRLVSQEDLDVARGKYEQAKADVDELSAMVGYTRVSAPFDGVVTSREVDPGALIEAQGNTTRSSGSGKLPLLTIADISTVRVYLYVPEQETSAIRAGAPATLTLREFPGRPFRGTVSRFTHALDLATRTMLTEVDIPNPDHALYPGMYAEATLELDRHRDALVLPASAVRSDGGASSVLVVSDGIVRKLPVAVGIADGADLEITDGLKADAAVVAHPTATLAEGEHVRAVAAEATASAG